MPRAPKYNTYNFATSPFDLQRNILSYMLLDAGFMFSRKKLATYIPLRTSDIPRRSHGKDNRPLADKMLGSLLYIHAQRSPLLDGELIGFSIMLAAQVLLSRTQ